MWIRVQFILKYRTRGENVCLCCIDIPLNRYIYYRLNCFFMFPIEPKDLLRPLLYAPAPNIKQPDSHRPIPKPFRLGSHQIRSKPDWKQIWTSSNWIEPANPATSSFTSQLFAVCLAACKYQHRKWCVSGDAVNPVWTPASWWPRVETGSKMAPWHHSLHSLCVWLMRSAGASFCCYIPAADSDQIISDYLWRGHNTAETDVWIVITQQNRKQRILLVFTALCWNSAYFQLKSVNTFKCRSF